MAEPLRILQVHNQYRPIRGGEETVVGLEADLLRQRGHQVERLSVWTGELNGAGALRLVAAGFGTVWSVRGYSAVKRAIKEFSPDIVHVHNTFPLLSPSVFWAAASEGVPVVQTLHNFRLTCANALLLRNDVPCQRCVGRFPVPALRYRCYHRSLWQTAAVTTQTVVHNWLGTFQNKVHAYIVLTEFSKEIMRRCGLPADRLYVKPNFVTDPGEPVSVRYRTVAFVGEISRPKGVHLLLQAWSSVAPIGYRLIIIGDGPDRGDLERRYMGNESIVWQGSMPRSSVIEAIRTSRWLVLPSLAYENFPMVIVEALSAGTPVVVPNHGAFSAIVSDERNGLWFSAGSAASLADVLQTALNADERSWYAWSLNARNKFLREYTDQTSYARLFWIYQRATACCEATAARIRVSRESSSRAVVSIPERERQDLERRA